MVWPTRCCFDQGHLAKVHLPGSSSQSRKCCASSSLSWLNSEHTCHLHGHLWSPGVPALALQYLDQHLIAGYRCSFLSGFEGWALCLQFSKLPRWSCCTLGSEKPINTMPTHRASTSPRLLSYIWHLRQVPHFPHPSPSLAPNLQCSFQCPLLKIQWDQMCNWLVWTNISRRQEMTHSSPLRKMTCIVACLPPCLFCSENNNIDYNLQVTLEGSRYPLPLDG
jgi:hypothetical protein